jgi:hypothetical protein
LTVAVAAVLLAGGLLAATPAAGDPPPECDDPSCVPGITPGVVLGTLCDNTTYFVFGTTAVGPAISQPGRLVFFGSPRRYQGRWFRSPRMVGIKEEGANCDGYLRYVAQAPDGLFLVCQAQNGFTQWVRGDARD